MDTVTLDTVILDTVEVTDIPDIPDTTTTINTMDKRGTSNVFDGEITSFLIASIPIHVERILHSDE